MNPGKVNQATDSATVPCSTARSEVRSAEIARGLRVKRNNAITAGLSGLALILLAMRLFGSDTPSLAPLHLPIWLLTVAVGALGGFIYANGFEYALHRFVLHWGNGFLVQRHALHHDSAGEPDEARYVNFATSPLVVVLVFVLNAIPVFAAMYLLRAGFGAFELPLAAGIFAGFTCYFVSYEEIHWRIHFGGWLPGWLRFARRHHLLHHKGFEGYHNVFLPIFDWMFHRRQWKQTGKPV